MKIKSIVIAAALASAAFGVMAAGQNSVTATGKTFSIGDDRSSSFTITTNTSGTLLGSSYVDVVGGGTLASVTFAGHAFTGSGGHWTLGSDIANFAAGTYTLNVVTGPGWDSDDFSYSGKIKFLTAVAAPFSIGSVAAIPEPESYAMLLAGLGALGFMGRRRQTNKV
jgi:hypothetical protein